MTSPLIQNLEAEARRIEEDAEHSFKGHYNASRPWHWFHLGLGLAAGVASAVAGAGIFAEGDAITVIAAVASVVLIAALTSLNPSDHEQRHKAAGAAYQSLRNQARMFRQIDLIGDSPGQELRQKLFALAKIRDQLNEGSPTIPRRAYERACKDINTGRATYSVDKED
ncbi:MAG: SLATT domain-containing protein [Gammaproteobacteria bacterium]